MSADEDRRERGEPPAGAPAPRPGPDGPEGRRARDERERSARRDERARLVARFLPGIGPAVVAAAKRLGMLAPYAPEAHWTAGDPIEMARAASRERDMELIAAAIALTLRMEEESLRENEPRVLTLRQERRAISNWWQTRIPPSSLPPRRIGPAVRSDVFRTPEPGSGAPGPGRAGRR